MLTKISPYGLVWLRRTTYNCDIDGSNPSKGTNITYPSSLVYRACGSEPQGRELESLLGYQHILDNKEVITIEYRHRETNTGRFRR